MGYGASERRFPPKNRTRSDLDVLQIELSGRREIIRLDPNGLAMAIYGERDLIAELGEPHTPDGAVSVLSGRPGYRYSDHEVDMILTGDELMRFVRYDLRPDEYLALRDRFGMFFMIHDDFYDEESGESLQPRPEPRRGPRGPVVFGGR